MNVGEIVVCINDKRIFSDTNYDLTIGKKYRITNIGDRDSISVINNNGREFGYFSKRFLSLKEHRKMKLNKIYTSYEGR